MTFDEVTPEHFTTFSRVPPPHLQMEQLLMQLGGGGTEGTAFKKKVLLAAGWSHTGVVSFGKYPQEACNAFNRLRLVLAETEQPEEILERLKI
ncbi:hypothetical protein [Aeromonas schubertii]|uniref:Uncharacterized protein n=1 Tax=Aeromonas schubertii TaxID=652 RepID=A0A0S2SPF0_9GAMM|nr:hypothetical protein [Aeromonas schubertii]ALP43556.1 hypothetical protein WL1483_4137 [Aeromonas schubertii]KUE81179.1 hypothetical protein ATO46_12915 [Aeromonas schubertii]MBZ6066565.1 hypothetical protein [Aeromonas schubertii]MBZ6073427.1 hypothetical protein [Aeromonas schubertii]QCG49657.1 hypothetical protein E2P79_19160 [Aeromonas schubertii]